MTVRLLRLLSLALLAGTPCWADPAKLEIHGMALGMTPEQAAAAAHLACSKPDYSSNVVCHDGTDGSDYHAVFSAGDPSIALSVDRTFCTGEAATKVLQEALHGLGVSPDRAHSDPNGYHIDLDGDNEAVLTSDDGSCAAGTRHYVFMVRSNSLIKMSSDKAVKRAKDALH